MEGKEHPDIQIVSISGILPDNNTELAELRNLGVKVKPC